MAGVSRTGPLAVCISTSHSGMSELCVQRAGTTSGSRANLLAEIQGCVDSSCPCVPDAVLVPLGFVVVPLHVMGFPLFSVYAWFDSGYMHCRIWQLSVRCLRCSRNTGIFGLSGRRLLCPLYPAVFGVSVWSESRYTLTHGVLVPASGRQDFVKFQCSGLWLHEKVFVFSAMLGPNFTFFPRQDGLGTLILDII